MKLKLTISVDQLIKNHKRINREIELETNGGWTSSNKIHKSDKTYSRKQKHKDERRH